jgi:hypothetical protein
MSLDVPLYFGPSTKGFTISNVCGCWLLYPLAGQSGVPIDAATTLSKLAGKKAVLSSDLARIWGAIWVVGNKKQIDAFAEHPDTTKQRSTLSAGTKGLTPAAVHWLEYGEFGLSSYAIFHRMTGQTPARAPRVTTEHPIDPGDLRRCLLLLEAVPEFKASFRDMRDVSEAWGALVGRWDELLECLVGECPDWHGGDQMAPATHNLMRGILNSVPGVRPAA